MCDRDFLIERGERARKRRRGVALHQEPIGSMVREFPLHRPKHRARQIGQALPRRHHTEVDIRRDSEQRKNILTQIAVLSGVVDSNRKLRPHARREHDRRELDCLGPSAEHDGDLRGNIVGHVAAEGFSGHQDWRASARSRRRPVCGRAL
jgi:hypothetical protein